MSVVKQRVDELAKRIDAPASLLPTYGRWEAGVRSTAVIQDREITNRSALAAARPNNALNSFCRKPAPFRR